MAIKYSKALSLLTIFLISLAGLLLPPKAKAFDDLDLYLLPLWGGVQGQAPPSNPPASDNWLLDLLPNLISAALPVEARLFPTDNVWNTRVDHLPVAANSDLIIATMGAATSVHPDFGSGDYPAGSGSPIGIPFNIIPGDQPKVAVSFTYASECDPGPYPVPEDPLIEGGPDGTGDRHILLWDQDNHLLYELYNAYPNGDGTWHAGSGAIYDLRSHALRPAGWTSADAAGLPVLPGLVRYEEVAAGAIEHALRFTTSPSRKEYIWPARHYASSYTGVQYPPMGLRVRLKASVDISGFHPEIQVIMTALKRYGMILADNGSDWYLSGAPHQSWDNDRLRELRQLKGSDFEVVDTSSMMIDPDSGQAVQP